MGCDGMPWDGMGKMDGWMDLKMGGTIDTWINRCMDQQRMDQWMDGWMDGWIDGWMDRRTDGWIDRQTILDNDR